MYNKVPLNFVRRKKMNEVFKLEYKNKTYVLDELKLRSVLESLGIKDIKRCQIRKYLKKYKLLDSEFLNKINLSAQP